MLQSGMSDFYKPGTAQFCSILGPPTVNMVYALLSSIFSMFGALTEIVKPHLPASFQEGRSI